MSLTFSGRFLSITNAHAMGPPLRNLKPGVLIHARGDGVKVIEAQKETFTGRLYSHAL